MIQRILGQLFFCVLIALAGAQSAHANETHPTKTDLVSHFGFTEHVIEAGERTVHFYQRGQAQGDEARLVLYLQGSDPSSQFSYRKTEDGYSPISWIPGDYRRLNPEDVFIIVEKPGFEGVFPEEIETVPDMYHAMNSLDDRVARADAVIRHLNRDDRFDTVVVYGHSEGAPVAAKLATINSDITHLGFWAGNALPDFFDFALQTRFAVHAGEISGTEAQQGIDEMLGYVANVIAADPDGTDVDDFGYTNKRWNSYAEPPINHLVQLDIPIFVQVATEDQSAPIETSYLIPLEFTRLSKGNLTYRVCEGCDHGFFRIDGDGNRVAEWPRIFDEFMSWTDER